MQQILEEILCMKKLAITFPTWRWRHYVARKRPLTSTKLHCVIFKKIPYYVLCSYTQGNPSVDGHFPATAKYGRSLWWANTKVLCPQNLRGPVNFIHRDTAYLKWDNYEKERAYPSFETINKIKTNWSDLRAEWLAVYCSVSNNPFLHSHANKGFQMCPRVSRSNVLV